VTPVLQHVRLRWGNVCVFLWGTGLAVDPIDFLILYRNIAVVAETQNSPRHAFGR